MLQKRSLRLTLFLVVAVVFLAGCGGVAAGNTPASSQATPVPPVPQDSTLVVDGVLVPARHVLLSASTGGRVVEVNVAPGQAVEAGDVLVRLDDARERAALTEAQARLERARAYLTKLQAGPRAEEIQVAQAAVEVARAQLAKIQQGASPAEVASAQAEVAAAQAALAELRRGPNPYELAAAQAELDNARAALSLAQAAYDRVKHLPDIAARPEALQLQRATNAYKVAEARFKALQQGPSREEVAAAEARLNAAQARLDALKAGPTAEDLAIARAQLRQAEAQLALAKAPPRTEDIDLAKADVAVAEAALQQAELARQQAEVRAPFAGIVGDIRVREGAYVAPGTPLLRLGDIRTWWVETTNLSELDVVHVRVGDPVTLTFDAIPDLEMQGHVLAVDPVGKNSSGDVLYTVYIEVEGSDERLRWGMTVAVRFQGKK